MLNIFQTLKHLSLGACDFSIGSPHGCVFLFRCVLEFRRGWFGVVSVWQAEALLQPATQISPQPNQTETPTHIETRTHNQCGDTIEKSQAPDDGCINVWNMLSIEVK